eukprot:13599887-Alexandrium_andersonii.AAC.1
MSASLVGSEMCIRDRAEAAGPGPIKLAELAQLTRSGWRMAQAQRGCPVSYTHLTLPTICSV